MRDNDKDYILSHCGGTAVVSYVYSSTSSLILEVKFFLEGLNSFLESDVHLSVS